MAWIDEAELHTSRPVALLEIDFTSGTRKYGIDFIRSAYADLDVISACDATADWTGTALSIDNADKKEGTGSLKDTIAAPIIDTLYQTHYNPTGSWDWSGEKHILCWVKCDRPSTAFPADCRLIFWDTSGNWRSWNLTFSAGEWIAVKELLSTGDSQSGTPPDLALVSHVGVRFKAADITPFYKKIDHVRVTGEPIYKGNILRLPTIYNSVGDLMRAFEFSRIAVEFSDTEYEFRTIIEAEGIKNREMRIKVAFPNRSLATESLTVFVGNIYDWDPKAGLKFVINCEQKSRNMGNEYPDKVVERGDYANAHADALGKVIPIIWGTISQAGGAFPTLFVDTTDNAERYLVGLQDAGADITVSAVYVDGAAQTEGAGNDYQIAREDIDGRRHTRIHFENTADPQPTEDTVVTCDLVFGAREVCEAIKYFMINFCGYTDPDFNDPSYQAAHIIEQNRGFTFNGAFTEKQTLSTILNAIKNEFELDMWWEPKDGLIHFNYLSSTLNPPITHYKDTFDILKGYRPGMQVEKILNYLRYGYNYNYAHDYFYNYDHHEDTDSQTKHGGTYTEFFGFRFVRSSIIAHDLASRKVLRRKEPVIFDTFPLPLKSFEDNLAEVVKITHFEGTGATGYVEKLFQIRKTSYDIDKFVNSMIAEDVDAFFGLACILGDATALPVLWANAVGFQRNYCYLCAGVTAGGETAGEFSDGEPGKQLRD